jgi:hypothetical protein
MTSLTCLSVVEFVKFTELIVGDMTPILVCRGDSNCMVVCNRPLAILFLSGSIHPTLMHGSIKHSFTLCLTDSPLPPLTFEKIAPWL